MILVLLEDAEVEASLPPVRGVVVAKRHLKGVRQVIPKNMSRQMQRECKEKLDKFLIIPTYIYKLS